MRRFCQSAGVFLVLVSATLVRADDGPAVLHEFVPDLSANEGTMLVSSGGAQPDAIVYRGEILSAPERGELQADEHPMRSGQGDGREREEAGRRSPDFRPDRVTELEGRVGYYTVFSPTIAPFKRVTALDRVALAPDGTPVLAIADRTRHWVSPVGSTAAPEDGLPRDQFWGSVVLDFAEGTLVPFPSVAPDARILTLETNPPTPVRIERDAADNFYASAPPGSARQVRVVFLTDAPRSYFGREIPDAPVDAYRDRVPTMPPAVRADALRFAGELGLTPSSTFTEALTTLTRHFRSFEESHEPPRNTGNIFLDLARGMRGICRHRAYGFVLTAQALGMHARFVQNEAHAWVEVDLPRDGGWLRVDLGGAATGLEAHNAEDRPVYQPETPDPLPRPEAYERAHEEAQRMSGLRRSDDGRPSPGGSGGTSGTEERGGTTGGAGAPGDGATGAGSRSVGDGARRALSLSLDRRDFQVFRGRELEITGGARGEGDGVPGLRVEAVLRSPDGNREWLLGVTVTNDRGRYRGVFGVPPDLAVGDYSLIVRSPGSSEWAPAIAR